MSLKKSTIRNYYRYFPTLFALAGMLASTANAMPYYNKQTLTSKLDASLLAVDPILSSAEVFADHLDSKTLYVSPASKKIQAGVFSLAATPACEILENQYALTYMVPPVTQDKWIEYALKGPVSGYFDFSVGIFLRNTTLIEELRSKVVNIESIREAHPKEVAAYEAALKEVEVKQDAKDDAQREYDKYPQRIKDLTAALIAAASNSELLASYNREIEATREEFVAQAPRLVSEIDRSTQALSEAASRLVEAEGEYKAAVPDETEIMNRIEVLTKLYEILQKSAKQAFDDNNKVLMTLETSGIGTASANYSIWGDEATRLKEVASRSGADFNVYRLPIYDIHIAPVQRSEAASTISSSISKLNDTLNNSNSFALVNASSTAIGDGTTTNASSFEANGQQVETSISTLNDAEPRTFQNLVTRGAYCTGSSKRNFVSATIPERNADNERINLQVGKFKSRMNPILAQSVALSYAYNLKNDPVDISCELDILKFSSWTSTKKSSGFLFWRKKKTNEERKMIQENGITCKNSMSDFGEANKDHAEEIMDKMTQEIGAEYILQYAKSYEITRYKDAELPNPGASAEKLGTAMQALCGGNIYCEVGSIVMKTGADLFGATTGSSSGSETITGKISRRYSEHSYTSLPGSAVIDLTVQL